MNIIRKAEATQLQQELIGNNSYQIIWYEFHTAVFAVIIIGLFHHVPEGGGGGGGGGGGCSQVIKSQGVKRLKQLCPGGINSHFNCV